MDDRAGAYDVVVVGGGVVGSAVALFLLREPAFDGRVAVIERDPTYRQASSALSASSIRQQFSTPENIRMSRFGFAFLRELARDGDHGADPIGLEERGYLYLASAARAAALERNHAVQVAEGAEVALLTPAELTRRFPWLDTEGVALGSLGLEGEGWFDGYALLQALRGEARARGAAFLRAEASGLVLRDDRIEGVALADGTTIGCGSLVNAAGPWAHALAAMAGVPLPVEARRRCVFLFEAHDPPTDCPLVVDTSGAWFRPEGAGFICGTSPRHDSDGLPLEVDRSEFEEVLWPALAARVPTFDALRQVRSWAGYYEYNTFDQNAIVGRHPVIANLLFANGFSGHGIQHAPAVGRAIAELLTHGRYTTLDLSVFGYERIAAGRRVVEENVIG